MASGTKLVYTFETNDGKTAQISYNYAQPSATLSNVKALAQAMITNTAIYQVTLVTLKSAKEVTTSEYIYDIDATSEANKYINMDAPEDEQVDATKVIRLN